VAGSTEIEGSKRLIEFLASARARAGPSAKAAWSRSRPRDKARRLA